MKAAGEAGFVPKTLALAAKDLRIEARARETLLPMAFFSLVIVLLLAFTVPGAGEPATGAAPVPGTVAISSVVAGFLWITVLFAGLIGFARSFEIEQTDGAMDTLLLLPLDRSGLFLAKALSNFAFVGAIQVFLIPAFALLFGFELGRSWAGLALVALLVDIGFVSIGTLFSAVAAQTRSRELILPILALPALVPVFIAGVELTADLFGGAGIGDVTSRGWFGLLAAFDAIFGVVAALAFDVVLD